MNCSIYSHIVYHLSRCKYIFVFFLFNDTATTEIYTLSLHDALPIFSSTLTASFSLTMGTIPKLIRLSKALVTFARLRSEEHTSELQSRQYLVCRLLLEKKNNSPP